MPVITVLGLDVGNYLTGSILTETIFSWPGVGRYDPAGDREARSSAVQGASCFLSVVFVLVQPRHRLTSMRKLILASLTISSVLQAASSTGAPPRTTPLRGSWSAG